MSQYGKVILTGAGPGEYKLITLKALNAIEKADVILYDFLANPILLKYAKEDAELIYVGKRAGHHSYPQEEIIKLIIEKAKEGKDTLRLKGGDPLIFGRGSEEALALKDEGIEFEFIPGITSGIAAATYSGIPITHRNRVTQTVLITGHEMPDKKETQVDWSKLAKMKNTNLIIYMGVSNMPKAAKKLITNGMDSSTKIAIIRNATFTSQESYITTLGGIEGFIAENKIKPPVIFIIGPTIEMRDDLNWFEDKPLFGKRIVATRAEDQAESLYNLLEDNGAVVLPCKVIKTNLITVNEDLNQKFTERKYDWIFFSSENGVRYFFRNLELQNLDARILGNSKIAVIGSQTGAALKKFGLIADFIPSKFTSKSLIEEFPKQFVINEKHVLRVKGDFENDYLFDSLIELKANTDVLEVYSTLEDSPSKTVLDDIKSNIPDAHLFTSMSTVNNFFKLFDDKKAIEILNSSSVFAIGPVTAQELKDKKIENVQISELHTIPGLVNTLIEFFK